MLDWTDDVRRDALDSGSGAPSGDPGVLWAKYLDTATGDVYTWDGTAWVKTGSLPSGADGSSDFGTAPTGQTPDAGGTGNLGWLGTIRKVLTDRLPAALTGGGGLKAGLVDALPAGTNNIGDVDVLSVPADPFGATADAAVAAGATGSISAKLRAISRDLVANIVLAAGEPTPSTYTNFGAATKANIKGSAGTLVAFIATNANATVRYIQVHNKATTPAATEVPLLSFPIPAGTVNNPGAVVLGISDLRRAFGTGIGFAVSTTLGTFTDSATAGEHSVEVGYL